MKQKSNSSKSVTRRELKTELKSLEKRIGDRLVSKALLRYELDKQRQELDDNAKKYRDEILAKLDGVMGEFEAIREDRTIAAYQTTELRQKVDEHEKRISALEKS